jgi:hypothetical protein
LGLPTPQLPGVPKYLRCKSRYRPQRRTRTWIGQQSVVQKCGIGFSKMMQLKVFYLFSLPLEECDL